MTNNVQHIQNINPKNGSTKHKIIKQLNSSLL